MHVRIVRFRSRARWRSGPRTSPRPQSAFSLQSSAFRKPRKLVLLTADCRLLTAGPGDFAGPGHVCVPSRRTDPAFRFATRSAEPIRPFGSPREAPNRSGLSVRLTKRRTDPAFRFATRTQTPPRFTDPAFRFASRTETVERGAGAAPDGRELTTTHRHAGCQSAGHECQGLGQVRGRSQPSVFSLQSSVFSFQENLASSCC